VPEQKYLTPFLQAPASLLLDNRRLGRGWPPIVSHGRAD